MNNIPNPGPETPRHRSERTPSADEIAAAYAEHVAERAPDGAAAIRVRDAFATHGTPLAVYLAFNNVDQYGEHLEAEFQYAYVGFYPDQESLVAETVESFEWHATLNRLLARDPLLRQVVAVDHDEVWAFILTRYDIVGGNGGLYVFEPEH